MDYNVDKSDVNFNSNVYPIDRPDFDIQREAANQHPHYCPLRNDESIKVIGSTPSLSTAIKCTKKDCHRFDECLQWWPNYTDEEFNELAAYDRRVDDLERDMVGEEQPEIDQTTETIDLENESIENKLEEKKVKDIMELTLEDFKNYFNTIPDSALIQIFNGQKLKAPGFRDTYNALRSPFGKFLLCKQLHDVLKNKLPEKNDLLSDPTVEGLEQFKYTDIVGYHRVILALIAQNKCTKDIAEYLGITKKEEETTSIVQVDKNKDDEDAIQDNAQETVGKKDIRRLRKRIESLEKENGNLKTDKAKLNKDNKDLKEENLKLKDEIAELKRKIKTLENPIGENPQEPEGLPTRNTKRILLVNLKAQDNFPYEWDSIQDADIKIENIPKGNFDEIWYKRLIKNEFAFSSLMDKLCMKTKIEIIYEYKEIEQEYGDVLA